MNETKGWVGASWCRDKEEKPAFKVSFLDTYFPTLNLASHSWAPSPGIWHIKPLSDEGEYLRTPMTDRKKQGVPFEQGV